MNVRKVLVSHFVGNMNGVIILRCLSSFLILGLTLTTTANPAPDNFQRSRPRPTDKTTTESPGCTRNGGTAKRVVEGDMVYYIDIEKGNNTRAGVITQNGTDNRWPANTVIFDVKPQLLYDRVHLNKIYRAMNDITNAVPNCVTFRSRNDRDTHWTTIQSDVQGCFSKVGYNPSLKREQTINFSNDCKPGNMVHELLHTLGFLHEHTRNDRDDYVSVDFSNIKKNYTNNFIKDKDYGRVTSYYGVSYNYASIMHYPLYSSGFANDEQKPTMTHLGNPAGLGYQYDISQYANRNFLSKGDLNMISRRYNCMESQYQRYLIAGANEGDSSEIEIAPPTESDAC